MQHIFCMVGYSIVSSPAQYRPVWRQFLQVRRPNQQCQSTEGSYLQQKQIANQHICCKNIVLYWKSLVCLVRYTNHQLRRQDWMTSTALMICVTRLTWGPSGMRCQTTLIWKSPETQTWLISGWRRNHSCQSCLQYFARSSAFRRPLPPVSVSSAPLVACWRREEPRYHLPAWTHFFSYTATCSDWWTRKLIDNKVNS